MNSQTFVPFGTLEKSDEGNSSVEVVNDQKVFFYSQHT